jgi:competence protein ComEC
MLRFYKRIAFVSASVLIFISISLYCLGLPISHKGILFVSFLNIGQGDGIFIQAPNGKQIMIDGGPDKIVLRELGKVMPSFDRTIDAILITNPDKDHIGGFVDILERYKVDYIIEPGTISKTDTYKTVESLAKENGLEEIYARRDMNILLDEQNNVYLHILFPDRNVEKLVTNDGSIIARLVYGDTSLLLEGDAPQKIERYLLSLDNGELNSDILKIGHHGSRTSTDINYIKAVSPDYAVISLGGDNKYGHPHKETLDTLNSLNVPILRTDLDGRISFVSDGETWKRE